MQIKIESEHLNGVVIIKPDVFEDDRGFFMEAYREDQFRELGLPGNFVQFNHSGSVKDVVRGLHFQYEPPMGKLMRVTAGEAFLVAVDLRKDSPTFGQWYGDVFDSKSRKMIWAPAGFGRGFCSLSDWVELQYLCTGVYSSTGEGNVLWNDPAIGVKWPVKNPTISQRDTNAPSLEEWVKRPESNHPTFTLAGE